MSSSRTMMDETSMVVGATVSLPHWKKETSPEGFTIDDAHETISKPAIEQMFRDELSQGSKPIVHFPHRQKHNSNVLAPVKFNLLKFGPTPYSPHVVGLSSRPELAIYEIHPKRRDGDVFVHMPGRIQKLKRLNR